MEWIADAETLRSSINKYKWVIFVIVIGILMMLFPEKNRTDISHVQVTEETEIRQMNLQQELEQVLSQMEGAGNVRVLLTESVGQQTIFQTDHDTRKTNDSEDIQKNTVILNDTDRSETGLIMRIDPPQYLGAIVLCDGADKPTVRLAIVDAVATATGLGSDRISVWKMK